jgi:hypothetical protein
VLDSQIESLVQSLSNWENLQSPPYSLAYPLVHQYTARNLSLSSLKGHDYQYARCLADSCARHGRFYLFLAQLEMYTSWPNDESSEDASIHDRQRFLSHVCDLEGFRLSSVNVDISNTFLLDRISYTDREPDTRTGGEYVGNQHMDFEETYSDRVSMSKQCGNHKRSGANNGC